MSLYGCRQWSSVVALVMAVSVWLCVPRIGYSQETDLDRLIQELNDKDSDVRRSAAYGLDKIRDPRAVEPLIATLSDKEWRVRSAAATALGHIGDPRAVEPLIATLRDRDRSVREQAAWALGAIGDPRAVDPLSAALNDREYLVREEVIEALGRLGDSHALQPLMDQMRRERYVKAEIRTAIRRIAVQDPQSVGTLISALNDQHSEVRETAAEALGGAADSTALEPLITALGDEYHDVRKVAAEALGAIGDSRAVEPLIALFRDDSASVRWGASRALGQIGDSRAVEPLIALFRADSSAPVRASAAQALGGIGDPRAVEPLISCAHTVVCARALGQIGDSRAVEPLIAALREGSDSALFTPDCRRSAAQALGQIGDPRAVQPLVAALERSEQLVRDFTGDTPRSRLRRSNYSKLCKEIRLALLKLESPEAVDFYVATLDSDDPEMALQAARTLLSLDHPKAREARPNATRVVDESVYVVETAWYDHADRLVTANLKNVEGTTVALKSYLYSEADPTRLIRVNILAYSVSGQDSSSVIHTVDYGLLGEAVNAMFLCLDEKGDLIHRDGLPVLVRPFAATQRSTILHTRIDPGLHFTETKIYRCANCAEMSGIENCRYVW
jgi:HEAT repeat protein